LFAPSALRSFALGAPAFAESACKRCYGHLPHQRAHARAGRRTSAGIDNRWNDWLAAFKG
jgi:hypothetical protein